MKKLLSITLLSVSSIIFVPSAEAKSADFSLIGAAAANYEPQNRNYQRQRRWNNGRVRVVNRTRIVRRGYATYRETWQYRYLPNGRVQTRLISRVRIR